MQAEEMERKFLKTTPNLVCYVLCRTEPFIDAMESVHAEPHL